MYRKISFKTIGLYSACFTSTYVLLKDYEFDSNSWAVVRLLRAASTAVKISAHYKSNLYRSNLDVNSREYKELRSQVHERAALELLNLCCTNRGVYIKVGQHIGALDYLVPVEYTRVLKVLHKDAPRSSYEEVLQVLRDDLKADPQEIFSSIDKEPIGAASLAQVHRAVLRDGTTVAVKVQHPYVRDHSKTDIKTMEFLVNILTYLFDEFDFNWLVNETKRNIPKELDFEQEGRNADKIRQLLQSYTWLKVPSVHWNLTTSRVLTMEYVEGGQVTDLQYMRQQGIDPHEVTSKLGLVYADMIFKHGFVHSDPHPGNILVKRGTRGVDIVLLDHGLYAELSEQFKWDYCKFWMSILNVDFVEMKRQSEALGVSELYPFLVCMITGRTWDAVKSGVNLVKYTEEEKEVFQRETPNFLTKIAEVLQTVNRQMILLLKTNDLMRGIEHTLQTGLRQSSFLVMSRLCVECIYRERLVHCHTLYCHVRLQLTKHWKLFQLSLYYLCLKFKSVIADWQQPKVIHRHTFG